jgi:glyoxylase-like metal-dependent hydrolase (beta-lactamase superfamily II)
MKALSAGFSYVDLQFRGLPSVIATAVLHGPGGAALIDPGPSSALPVLRDELRRAGIALADVGTVLLTHIHLDHAGAVGTILAENPDIRVFVHEQGAPHLIDPRRLLASAARLYGEEMDRLWGEVRSVPAGALTSLTGNERIEAAGHPLEVAHTPGHARHHVSYFSRDTGLAFVGDTAGIRLVQRGYVLPPTPPPDVDLQAWQASLHAIEAWRPDTLFLTHFGPSAPVVPHLRELGEHLELVAGLVRTSLAREETDEAREAWFVVEIRREIRRRMSEADARAYDLAGRFDLSWRGLARYWRKRG